MHDLYEGWTEALHGLGEQVWTFNLDRRLQFFDAALINDDGAADDEGHLLIHKALTRPAAIEMATHEILKPAFLAWPDVVLLISGFWYDTLLLDVMRGRGMKVVLLHTETPYQTDEQLTRAAHADINLVNDPTGIELYREFGPAEYMPHSYRPPVHHPAAAGAAKKWDLSFVGTGFPVPGGVFRADGPGRAGRQPGRAVARPAPGLAAAGLGHVRARGVREQRRDRGNLPAVPVRPQRLPPRIRAGPRRRRLGDGPPGGRARRVRHLVHPGPAPANPTRILRMLPSFTSPAEASDQIRWALANPAARDKAAAQARAAIEDRTFDANAKRLLKLLS